MTIGKLPDNEMLKKIDLHILTTQLLVGMPRLVMELGRTVVMSNMKDFPLTNTGRTFKYMLYPESYRACLHQACCY